MNVLPAWERGFRGKGVVVSILDDGIEKDHPDLKNNYVSINVQGRVRSLVKHRRINRNMIKSDIADAKCIVRNENFEYY